MLAQVGEGIAQRLVVDGIVSGVADNLMQVGVAQGAVLEGGQDRYG